MSLLSVVFQISRYLLANTNAMETKNYKRQQTGRGVSPETARKISDSLKMYNATHPRPDAWKQAQSDGLKKYWEQIPIQDDNGESGMDDIIL